MSLGGQDLPVHVALFFNYQMGSRNYAFLVCSTDHRSSLGVQRSVAIFGISSDQIGLEQGSVGNGW